jgi:hemolysin III
MLSLDLRQQPEEAVNTLTHGIGAVVSALGGAALVAMAVRSGDVYQIVSACVYSLSLIVLYTASTFFHWEQDIRLKQRLEIFDHCAIFLMIGGSYTPFMLVTLRESVGWTLLAVIWTLVIVGISFKLVFGTRFRLASTLLYLALGWLIIIVIEPMFRTLPTQSFILLVLGGLAYTLGTYFFSREDRLPYAHPIWHLFVLVGSACHFLAVAYQVVPG